MIEAFDSLARQHAKEMDEAHDTIVEYQTLCREMLAALRDLLAGMEQHGAEKWMPHRMERARAAIAKAGG